MALHIKDQLELIKRQMSGDNKPIEIEKKEKKWVAFKEVCSKECIDEIKKFSQKIKIEEAKCNVSPNNPNQQTCDWCDTPIVQFQQFFRILVER